MNCTPKGFNKAKISEQQDNARTLYQHYQRTDSINSSLNCTPGVYQ